MKYFQEVTDWTADYAVPNHIYYMNDSKTHAVGYIPAGSKKIQMFSKPMQMYTKGRKFQVLSKRGEPDSVYFQTEKPTKEAPPKGEVLTVAGSGGKTYYLQKVAGKWQCSCPGYGFRRTCKHSVAAAEGKISA